MLNKVARRGKQANKKEAHVPVRPVKTTPSKRMSSRKLLTLMQPLRVDLVDIKHLFADISLAANTGSVDESEANRVGGDDDRGVVLSTSKQLAATFTLKLHSPQQQLAEIYDWEMRFKGYKRVDIQLFNAFKYRQALEHCAALATTTLHAPLSDSCLMVANEGGYIGNFAFTTASASVAAAAAAAAEDDDDDNNDDVFASENATSASAHIVRGERIRLRSIGNVCSVRTSSVASDVHKWPQSPHYVKCSGTKQSQAQATAGGAVVTPFAAIYSHHQSTSLSSSSFVHGRFTFEAQRRSSSNNENRFYSEYFSSL